MSLISVIVPVYDNGLYIIRCIESILSQTYYDFELILVDDGSNDFSAKICDEYGFRDNRIRIIHQKNFGVSSARNNGVIIADGEYLTFVDSDDYIDVSILKKLHDACMKNKAQIAFCDYSIVTGSNIEEKRCIEEEQFVFSKQEAMNFYAWMHLKKNNALFRSPCAKLIHKSIVINILFPTNRKYAEDAACVYLWIWDADKIVHVNFCGYYYYQNPNSICHQTIGDFFVGNFMVEEEWICFFNKHHFDELSVLSMQRYIYDAELAYRESNHNKIFFDILRNGLRKYSRKAGINVRDYAYYYEKAFPKEMKIYWYYQSLKSKLKRK